MSGAAATVIAGMVGTLVSAVVYQFKRAEREHAREVAQMRADFEARLAERDAWLSEWKRIALGLTDISAELAPEAREHLRIKRGG